MGLLLVAYCALGSVPCAFATGVATTTTLSVSPAGPQNASTPQTLTATVTATSGGAAIHPGTVNFYDITNHAVAGPDAGHQPQPLLIGTAQLQSNGHASIKVTLGNGAVHSLHAAFVGTTSAAASASSVVSDQITATGSNFISLVASSVTNAYGGVPPQTYGVDVQVTYDGYTPPPGSLLFTDTSTSTTLGTTNNLTELMFGVTGLLAAGPQGTSTQGTVGVVTGDFNGDGLLDLAFTNSGAATISVFLNTGGGTFGTEHTYAVGSSASTLYGGLAVGDFNNDGKLDLAVPNFTGSSVSILLGAGDGTFPTHTEYTTDASPTRVAVSDFNEDGVLDLALVTDSGKLDILLGNADGTFGAKTSVSTQTPVALVVADFNMDGHQDIITSAGASEGIDKFFGNGDGTFQTLQRGYPPLLTFSFDMAAADFNGDGKPDLAVIYEHSGGTGALGIALNDGTGAFTNVVSQATGNASRNLSIADLNGDGWPDAAFTTTGANIASGVINIPSAASSTLLGLSPTYSLTTGASSVPEGVVTGDFTGTGLAQIAVSVPASGFSLFQYEQQNQGSFGDASYLQSGIALSSTTSSVSTNQITATYQPATPDVYSTLVSNAVALPVYGSVSPTISIGSSALNYGQSTTINVTVPTLTGVTPTGTVDIRTGPTTLSPLLGTITLASGSGSLTLGTPNAGTYTFYPYYNGDAHYIPSSQTPTQHVNLTVTPETPTISVTSTPSSQIVYGFMTFTAAVGVTANSPLGITVNFSVGGSTYSCATDNTGHCSVSAQAYLGMTSLNASVQATTNLTTASASTTISVFQVTPTPVLSSSSNPALPGRAVTISVTIATVGGVIPTGTVHFTDANGTVYGQVFGSDPSLNSAGMASFTLTSLPVGQTVFSAAYSGDPSNPASYLAATSSPLTQTIAAATIAFSLSSSASVTAGSPATVSATLTAGGNPVGGTFVSFFDAASAPTLLGTATTNSSGVATLARVLGVGTHTLTAVFGGFGAGLTSHTSNTATTVVTGAAGYLDSGTLALTGTPGSYVLTDTASFFGSAAPASPASFLDTTNGNASLGTGTLSGFTRHLAAPVAYTVGTSLPGTFPMASATGDLNGDGILDLVVANYNDGSGGSNYTGGSISVLLGVGDGTFTTHATITTVTNPNSVSLVDTDGDGKLDLIALNDDNQGIDVLLGDGAGNFGAPIVNSLGPGNTYAVQIGDFNKDGVPDLIATGNSGSATFFQGNGDGTFGDPSTHNGVTLSTGNGSTGITTGDYNQDGNLDFAVTNSTDGTVQVFLGDGTGNFTAQSAQNVGSYPNAIVTGDFNGDGKPDLAVTNQSGGTIGILLGNGNGTFQTMVTYAAGTNGPGSLSVADVNGDGLVDLLVSNSVTINGGGTGIYLGGNSYDNLSSDDTIGVFTSKGDGTFNTMVPYTFPAGSHPYSVTVGDFNGDGLPDLAVTAANLDNVGILLGYRTGTATLSGAPVNNAGPVLVGARYVHGSSDAYATSALSNTVQLQGSSTPTISSSAASSPHGTALTLTVTVAAQGGVTPTGTVQLKDGGTNLGAALTLSSGSATYTTSVLTQGTHTLTAVYSGDASFVTTTSAAFTQTITLPTTVDTLTASTGGSAVSYGTSITFTATLADNTATGTITFMDGATPLGSAVTLASGIAHLTTTTLTGGAHSITALYSGDSNFSGNTSSPLSQTINLSSAATTTLTGSGTPSTYGTAVTFTATLGNAGATGTVAFKDGGTTIGAGTVAAGVATFATSTLNVGSHPITAVYSGDTNFATTTSSALTEVIGQATPTLAAPTLSPTSAVFGSSVTLTQTVPSGLTGSITFYANGVSLGSGVISGTTATLATTAIPGGTNSITGGFAGNANYTAATSAAASITISPATPSIPAPTASPNPSVYGASVTLTQTMPAGATGSVTFYAGATSLGTSTLSGGVATLATAALPVGTLTLTTHFAGNANFVAATSAAGSTVVNPSPTATTLSASPTSGSYGVSVTLTATVTAGGSPVVGGTVNFQVAGATIGTGSTNGSGVASYTTTTLNAGANSVTAVSVASGNYNSSTSSAATVTISQATPTLGAPTLSPTSSTYGTSVTLTQAVPAGATGTVNFYSGGVLLGTATVSGGVATLTTTAIPAGTNAITGVYSGNSNYTTATSAAASIVVAQATPTLSAPTASPTSATFGTSVALTQVVPANATGTVTFFSNGVSLGSATISGGAATLTTTSLATGTLTLNTQYGGNANYTAATSPNGSIVISVAPTVTLLAGSPTNASFGTSIVLSATVTAYGSTIATGTVDFQLGGVSLGTAAVNGSGVASLSTTTLNVASNVITAVFSGTVNYAGSSSVATITITQATPSLAAPGISPAGGPYGTSITLTQSFPPGATGTASFYSGGVLLGTANISGGVATLITTGLPAGSNSVTTQWPGSGNYTSATSAPATVVITQATPVLGAPSASPANPAFGSPVTLTQAVPPGATGTVTFTSGGVTLGTGTIVNGVATITTSVLPAGSNAILATYNGNSNYTAATATGSVTVSPATPALGAPVATPSTGPYGTSVTLTLTVPSGLTGSITFMAGGTVLGTATITGGVATLVAPLLPAGSTSITGLFGGNGSYGPATSAATTVTLSQITPTLAAPTASPSSITYGGSVTLTQTVPAGATGTVTFASGATVLGTATISGGVATLVTTGIPGGSSAVTGLYSGNNNFTSALSAAATVTVAPVVPVLAQPGASPTGGPYGTPITLTQTMPPGATGTVTFTVNGVTLGTATIVNGVATLTMTAIPVGTNLTVAAYPGNGNYSAATSAAATITITQATPVLPGTTVSPASAAFGSAVIVSQAVPSGATGTVTFVSAGVTLGTATIAGGVATLTTTTLPLGSQTVAGTYNGNTNFAAATAVPGSVTITQATPVLAAPSAAPPSATYGASVMLTQTVPSGLTGTITFMSGASVLGTATISGGVATLTTTALATGSNAITGVYGGSTNYTSATSPATTVTITPASTTLAAPSASPSSITYGGSVTLTQTVPPGATGTVTFTSGSTVLGTATIVNGLATLVTTSIPGGTSPVVGLYNGSTNYAPVASAAATVVVIPAVPVLASPGASPSGGAYGTAVTLTQTVPSGATGVVTFTANGVVLGTAPILNGVATLTTTSIPAGSNITVGAYPGNGNYTTGTSAPTTITITQATPVLAAPVASPSPASFGSSVTLTLAVPAGATGTVVFTSGSTVLGTATISGGVAALATTVLTVGTDPIAGAYSGNANYSAATSPTGSAVITAAAPPLAAPSASPSSASYGSPVTLTQTVPPGATGTITFMSGSTVLGTATIVNGVATLTTTALPGGTNTVTSVYSGGGNYAPTTSLPGTVTIAPVTPVLSAPVASPTSAPYGTSVTLSQAVAPGVTGTITFLSGSTVLGTATIVNGVATLTTTALPPGSNSVTSVYNGNGNYTTANSPATTVTIGASATTVGLTASPLSATVGATVSFTASVSANGGPVGSTTTGVSVQFFDGTVSLGSALLSSNGVATLAISTLSVGSHVVTARFPGSGVYPAGTSAPVTVAVTQIAATLPAPVASPAGGVYGTSIVLTETMPAGATGTISFVSGGVSLGTATIVNGVATLATTAIPAGTNAITAVYSGNTSFAAATSAPCTVVMQQATPATPTLMAAPATAVFGTPVTLTATFPGGLAGSVSFFSGATTVGTAVIANGVATLTTSALPVGTDAVVATFTGNTNFSSVSSASVTVTITPPTYTITANPSSLTIHAGQTGTTVLTFTPVGGYTGSFTISCSGLPANAACQFLQNGLSNPTVVMNGSNQPVQATLNLMTSVPTATARAVSPAGSAGSSVSALLLPFGVLVLAGSVRSRRRLRGFGSLFSLLTLTLGAGAVLTGLAGCGGGGFGVTATPVGSSVVQVTATASAVSTPGSGNGGAPAPALSLSITIIQ